jgi:hypothetical protein
LLLPKKRWLLEKILSVVFALVIIGGVAIEHEADSNIAAKERPALAAVKQGGPGAVLFFAGAETGDAAEGATASLCSADNSTGNVASGAYSYKCGNNGGANSYVRSQTGLAATTLYARVRWKTNLKVNQGALWTSLIGDLNVGPTICLACLYVAITPSGAQLQIWYYGTPKGAGGNGTQLGSSYTLPDPTHFHAYELKFVVSPTVGEAHARVDGAEVITATGLNTGSAVMDSVSFGQDSAVTSGSATVTGYAWADDLEVNSSTYPGMSQIIARQCSVNGYSAQWTLSTGSLISGVIDNTPVGSTGTNINAASSGYISACTVHFGNTRSTGSTGFGSQFMTAGDTVNALKIGAYGRTASTSSDGADSTIFRTSAGAFGSNTRTALAAWRTTAAPGTYQDKLVTTPTAAQMLVSSLINGSNSFKGTLDVRS